MEQAGFRFRACALTTHTDRNPSLVMQCSLKVPLYGVKAPTHPVETPRVLQTNGPLSHTSNYGPYALCVPHQLGFGLFCCLLLLVRLFVRHAGLTSAWLPNRLPNSAS